MEFTNPLNNECNAHVRELFKGCFGKFPEFISIAPARANLIGEHTDYNDGFVFPITIPLSLKITFSKSLPVCDFSPAHKLSIPETRSMICKKVAFIYCSDLELLLEIDLDWCQNNCTELITALESSGHGLTARYIIGSIVLFQNSTKSQIPSFCALITSDIPIGGGVSSSAALCIALLTMFETLTSSKFTDKTELAKVAQKVEHEWSGTPCGLMDQLAIIYGKKNHACLIDCRTNCVDTIYLGNGTICFLLLNSGVKHSLANSEYAKRRAECKQACDLLGIHSLRDFPFRADEKDYGLSKYKGVLPEKCYNRALHVISENDRVLRFKSALLENSFSECGQLMYESHESLRGLYEVSCAELDELVQICKLYKSEDPSSCVHGARMTGGGFGGSIIVLLSASQLHPLLDFVKAKYSKANQLTDQICVSVEGAHSIALL